MLDQPLVVAVVELHSEERLGRKRDNVKPQVRTHETCCESNGETSMSRSRLMLENCTYTVNGRSTGRWRLPVG